MAKKGKNLTNKKIMNNDVMFKLNINMFQFNLVRLRVASEGVGKHFLDTSLL